MEFTKPTLQYLELSPMLVVFGVACLGVIVEAFLPRERRHRVQVGVAALGLLGALVLTVVAGTRLAVVGDGAGRGVLASSGTVVVDGPTVFLWGLVLIFALLGVALFSERRLEDGVSAFAGQAAALPGTEAEREASTRGLAHTEVYPLLMFAVGGMLLFPAAGDLLTMFVGLEVLSLPLYLLCGLARRRRLLSQEAAMKYFLLGAFSSGFFIYGIALVYGFAGSMQLAEIAAAVGNDTENRALLAIGIGMLAVGLLFKVGAVPFHSWTPDVYQGAPTAVTAFMAAATKVAAFGALLRLFYVAFGSDRWTWQPMMWVIAILTMLVGSVLATVQSDVKRILAYSSVAHTGFLLTGLLGLQSAGELAEGQVTSLQATMFYLATYGFATLGAFAVVTLVRDSGGEATGLDRWEGLGQRSPLMAAVFAFFLLSMAGIPLTSGFVGKWAVFTVAMSAGAWPVVLVAIASSVIAVFFYARVIRVMFFASGSAAPVEGWGEDAAGPDGTGPTRSAGVTGSSAGTALAPYAGSTATGTLPPAREVADVTVSSVATTITIGLCAAITLVLGIVPGPVLELAAQVGGFLR